MGITQYRDYPIREVWAENLNEEMAKIALILENYNYVAMDTEFPGVLARPIGTFKSKSEYNYRTLGLNVDMLKIIQLGLAFADSEGNSPKECACWQFNFEFNLLEDMYAQDTIDLLTDSGLRFQEHERRGIKVEDFGALLMESGLVLCEDVHWISFSSFYYFGYLLKTLTCSELPKSQDEFLDLLRTFFPNLLDMKYLELVTDGLQGGINKLAETYGVQRYGQVHQAGSDSLLTLHVYFKMKSVTFNGEIDAEHYGILYGIGSGIDDTQDGEKMLTGVVT